MKRLPLPRSLSFSGVLSVLSITIALLSFVYTMRTFAVTHRPYVGVLGVQVASSPTTLSWKFVLKNTGSVPARVRYERNETTVTTNGRTVRLPVRGDPSWYGILMPGVETEAVGRVNDGEHVSLGDIHSGRTTLEVDLVVRYEETGALLWTTQYRYAVKQRFRPTLDPPTFMTLSGEAD
jgi:hypothetical protein